METILLIAYIAVLIVQVVLLVSSIRKKSKKSWLILCLLELISLASATGLFFYYNSLTGYGMMPGLTYLGEVLFSYGAALVYGGMLAVSVIIYFIGRKTWY